MWYDFLNKHKSLTKFSRGDIMKLFKRKKQKDKKSRRREKWEVFPEKAIDHSSLGEFSQGDKKHPSRLKSGGHGEENIQELKRREIKYNITKEYPNGVRVGSIPTHEKIKKRTGDGQSWFPKSWTRNTIKRAAEKTIREEKEKKKDGETSIGTYKKVKVGVIRTKGIVATIFPLNKQSGGKRK